MPYIMIHVYLFVLFVSKFNPLEKESVDGLPSEVISLD